MRKADTKADPGKTVISQRVDKRLLSLVGAQAEAGGEQQLAPGQPGSWILKLRDMDPPDRHVELLLPAAHGKLQLTRKVADGEHSDVHPS